MKRERCQYLCSFHYCAPFLFQWLEDLSLLKYAPSRRSCPPHTPTPEPSQAPVLGHQASFSGPYTAETKTRVDSLGQLPTLLRRLRSPKRYWKADRMVIAVAIRLQGFCGKLETVYGSTETEPRGSDSLTADGCPLLLGAEGPVG